MTEDERKAFREACDAAAYETGYGSLLYIYDIRRRLGWKRELFDQVMRELRDSNQIMIVTSDAHLLSRDEIKDSFIDLDDRAGELYTGLMWRD